ncbi:uncharacterized protein NDAI_0H01260 [Naumovozyma dairenensis CBS 421]|uniref:Uncharacterized protein n=1 Tax=Naumovozyma dairenensis (strain ATCC 10597 / BCRC 20456 / CBS 421 / NBRC 0211 / NRRL Y-12639) TaxID=1071378 RepID=G0WET9_NAUDC|nr:hypothetical protein NDAI_0H01260 [Naumovozyma dairenensis CBS 421]CCD26300.1 hypothetical protein NDAI_0H01260 [Naumovozyma dairenensis CBS 421]
MSTLLQLMANYYKAVIANEKIYYDYLIQEHEHDKNQSEQSISAPLSSSSFAPPTTGTITTASTTPRMIDETLLLQKQLTTLTAQLQELTKENDHLKELQKSTKSLMETKLNSYKKRLSKTAFNNNNNSSSSNNSNNSLKLDTTSGKNDNDTGFHLLSPINTNRNKSKLPGKKSLLHNNYNSTSIKGKAEKDKNEGVFDDEPSNRTSLREVLSSGKHTLFDDDDEEGEKDGSEDVNVDTSEKNDRGKASTADSTSDVLFLQSFNDKSKSVSQSISKPTSNPDSNSKSMSKKAEKKTVNKRKNTGSNNTKKGKKKLRLIRKKVHQKLDDNDNDNDNDE